MFDKKCYQTMVNKQNVNKKCPEIHFFLQYGICAKNLTRKTLIFPNFFLKPFATVGYSLYLLNKLFKLLHFSKSLNTNSESEPPNVIHHWKALFLLFLAVPTSQNCICDFTLILSEPGTFMKTVGPSGDNVHIATGYKAASMF